MMVDIVHGAFCRIDRKRQGEVADLRTPCMYDQEEEDIALEQNRLVGEAQTGLVRE